MVQSTDQAEKLKQQWLFARRQFHLVLQRLRETAQETDSALLEWLEVDDAFFNVLGYDSYEDFISQYPEDHFWLERFKSFLSSLPNPVNLETKKVNGIGKASGVDEN